MLWVPYTTQTEKQKVHNKPLPKDCYKLSIDQSIVDAACIPDEGNNPFKTVKESVGSFVAWPKDQVLFDEKVHTLYQPTYIYLFILNLLFDTFTFCFLQVTPPNSLQKVDENKTAPKLQTKRKATYISREAMQKQARPNMKSQKSLNL